jgi:peptidoglycan/LPS O-acetylase OafA/YrhL
MPKALVAVGASADLDSGASDQSGSPLPRRLPSLDGWRAVSIILVLGYHSLCMLGFPPSLPPFLLNVFDGDFGVRCFFVISGFLITWLLINEQDSDGRVSLKHFYIRRALRILPVYFAFIAVLFCLQLITPFRQSLGSWIANITFTTDFYNISVPSDHLWSLSVEEQFYLLWPVLFVSLAIAKTPRSGLIVLSLPVLVAPVWRVISYKQFYPPKLGLLFAQFSFFNYFDCLAIGCLGAVVLRNFRGIVQFWGVNRRKTVAVTALILILLPYLMGYLRFSGRIIVASKASLQAFGFAVLMLQSIHRENAKYFAALNWRWIRHIGVLSYSMYIWQQIFFMKPGTFGLPHVWWMSFPGWLLSVLVAAHISYYCLERPLLQLRSRFR